jgi:hypothetical protein
MTFIARQRISKDAFLTIEAAFSVGSLQSGYKEVSGSIGQNRSNRVENKVEFRDVSLSGYALGLN